MNGIMQRLQAFDFVQLFNELGWDQLRVGLEKEVDGHLYELQPVAIKKGVQVLHCAPGPNGEMPTYAVRQKIERKVTPDARKYLDKGALNIQSFQLRKSKHLIDGIDVLLSKVHQLTPEQLDFIINYDIKYRMGLNGEEADADE